MASTDTALILALIADLRRLAARAQRASGDLEVAFDALNTAASLAGLMYVTPDTGCTCEDHAPGPDVDFHGGLGL